LGIFVLTHKSGRILVMLLSLALFILGLIILIKGAEFLINGASSLALRFKINPMVIGLTVVAFGTSAPELVVSVTSALSGNTELAFGNIIGSNISNILLILGISAVITPLVVQKNTVWKEVPMLFLAAIVLLILGFQRVIDFPSFNQVMSDPNNIYGKLSFSDGLILLSFFVIFIYYTFGIAKITNDEKSEFKSESFTKTVVFLAIGLTGLTLGSSLLVDSSVNIAKTLGVSQHFIGLTLVAVGTSIPELATSIMAALKKQLEMAVGNVVGSNIFNIFLILGITSLIASIPVTREVLNDIMVLFGSTAFLFVSFFILKKRTVGRIEGIAMLIFYFGYIYYLITNI
jgi:cation:H+ antiporter